MLEEEEEEEEGQGRIEGRRLGPTVQVDRLL